jgi:hypothetical protein
MAPPLQAAAELRDVGCEEKGRSVLRSGASSRELRPDLASIFMMWLRCTLTVIFR